MSVEIETPTWVPYELSAPSLAAVVELLEAEPEAGRCDWRPVWSSQEVDGVVQSVEVRVPIDIHYPEWSEYASANDAEQTEWGRFVEALQQHELGHADLVTEQLSDVDTAMVGLSNGDASHVFDDRLQALQDASDEYDSRTDHGRNDGTVITVP